MLLHGVILCSPMADNMTIPGYKARNTQKGRNEIYSNYFVKSLYFSSHMIMMMMLMIMKTTMLMLEYDIGKLYLSRVAASIAMLKKKCFHFFIYNKNVYDNDENDGIHAKM